MSADKGQKRKRPASYYIKSANKSNKRIKRSLAKGMRGFLLTCNNREKEAIRDAYHILNQHAVELYGEEKLPGQGDVEEDDSDEDIDQALKKEVSAIKEQQPTERRFQQVDSGANNVLFVKTSLDDPNELMEKIMAHLQSTKTAQTRFIERMLPVAGTCRAECLEKDAEAIVERFFKEKGVTFRIGVKIRNNHKLKRESVIRTMLDIIQSVNAANCGVLHSPELTVNVDVVRAFACISVVRNFDKFKKYNLQEIVKEEKVKEEEKKEADAGGETDKTQCEEKKEADKKISESDKAPEEESSEIDEKCKGGENPPEESTGSEGNATVDQKSSESENPPAENTT